MSTEGPAERVPDAPGAPCAGVPVLGAATTLAEALRADQVAIDGVPRQGPGLCTLKQCGERSCCNRCSAAYTVTVTGDDRAATAIQLAGLEGCRGTECGLDCKPFGREPTRPYRFVGRLVEHAAHTGERYRLDVERFCATDAPPAQPEPARPRDPAGDQDELDPEDQQLLDELLEE